MRLPIYLVSGLALLATSVAIAQTPVRPAAPQVTVGGDLKQLIFDWSPVALATSYQVLVNADGHSGFTPLGNPIPATQTRATINIAVHLQRWPSALYLVSACNLAGCRDSAQIFPRDQMLDTIGYIKSSNSDAGDQFGNAVSLSSDGNTLAVTAKLEASSATGINGDQADNSYPNGAVYIFRRVSGHWRQEAYLKGDVRPSNFGTTNSQYQESLSLSGDGSMLAVAEPSHDGPGIALTGLVFIYRRASSGSWSKSATLAAPMIQSADFFGHSIDLSLDGRTLKVTALQPETVEGAPIGTTYLFKRAGNTWQLTNTFAPYYAGDRCEQVRMSGDGNTLVSNCFMPTDPSFPNGGSFRIVTLKRSGANWVHTPDINLPKWSSQPFALNFGGTMLALVEVYDVVVYRWSGAAWSREMLIARPALTTNEAVAWGQALAFDKAGTVLAIGDFLSPAGGAGVMAAATQSNTNDGAVFMYERTSSATQRWRLRSVVKAPNPGNQDDFGMSLALCGTGRTLAVGASPEASAARGIDGNQSDESAPGSGAVYLY